MIVSESKVKVSAISANIPAVDIEIIKATPHNSG